MFDLNFVLNLVVYGLSLAYFVGIIKTQIQAIQADIHRLEKKQDNHNTLVERLVCVERDAKALHTRFDEFQKQPSCSKCENYKRRN